MSDRVALLCLQTEDGDNKNSSEPSRPPVEVVYRTTGPGGQQTGGPQQPGSQQQGGQPTAQFVGGATLGKKKAPPPTAPKPQHTQGMASLYIYTNNAYF